MPPFPRVAHGSENCEVMRCNEPTTASIVPNHTQSRDVRHSPRGAHGSASRSLAGGTALTAHAATTRAPPAISVEPSLSVIVWVRGSGVWSHV